jgi:hypothetical protein
MNTFFDLRIFQAIETALNPEEKDIFMYIKSEAVQSLCFNAVVLGPSPLQSRLQIIFLPPNRPKGRFGGGGLETTR